MKTALIGYGNMGKMIEQILLNQGHTIVARITSHTWDWEALQKADICLEFTHPAYAVENVRKLAHLKKPIVIGTTGWYEQMELVRSIVEENHIGLLYAPNFSLGIHLLLEILAHASHILDAFDEYDAAGIEYHHRRKQDSPSGTALAIANTIQKNMQRIKEFPFSSVRCGSIPGTHEILFDSPCDTISIKHEARNREGFAKGAVLAAEWLLDKKGLYTFADCIRQIQGIRHL